MNKTKVIIDCSSIIYSSFFAYGTLSYDGKPTSVIYGFLSKLRTILSKLKTNDVYFCFDHHKNKREDEYPKYKEKRKKNSKNFTDYELKQYKIMTEQAIELYNNVLPNIGFRNIFRQSGYEADDLMTVVAQRFYYPIKGTDEIRKYLKHHKIKDIVIVTSDNDMYQCLDYCKILNPSTMKMITKKSFMDKYNVHPSQWAICKSIGGCEGDNVIGIKGVSDPKKPTSKALKYIRGEIKKGIVLTRIESKDGQETIKRNYPIVLLPYKVEEMKPFILRRNQITKGKIIKVFDKYSFKSFLKTYELKKWESILLG